MKIFGLDLQKFLTNRKVIWVLVALLVVLGVVGSYLYVSKFIADRKKAYPTVASLTEGFASKRSIVLYHLPGCVHCKNMMPEWDKFARQHQNDQSIDIKKVNSDKHPDEAQRLGIKGFPTIVLFRNGRHTVYKGERGASALKEFISS